MTTTIDFDVAGPGSFAVAANWNPATVPNSSDDAVVNTTDGDAIINATQETVNGIGTGITDAVRVENDAALTLKNGTDTLGNFGSIVINLESQLAIDGGTVDNASVIELAGFNVSGFAAFMSIQGQVTLDGGGQVEMLIGGGAAVNLISGAGGNTLLLNQDNTISGDGTLGDGLKITNESAGLIETNNSTNGAGGHMQFWGTVGGGNLVNDGTMRVDPTGEFIFGVDSYASTINNESQIILDPDLQSATIEIAGNVTIQATFGTTGRIEMEGPGSNGNQIVSDGHAASLTLYSQTVNGAGTIGDANLTLTVLDATIDADDVSEPLLLYTGSNTITNNSGILVAFGGDLVIESPVNNINGIIEENGDNGIIDLFAPVTGSGTINVDQGILDVHAAVADNITFTGGAATIIVESGASLQGMILGASATDAIDVKTSTFTSSAHAVWEQTSSTGGVLLLYNDGADIANFDLSGTFTSLNFAVTQDSGGGTLITVQNTPSYTDNPGNNDEWILSDGNWAASAGPGSHPSGYYVADIGHWTSDGTDGILWFNPSNGDTDEWQLSNAQWSGSVDLGSHPANPTDGAGFQIAGSDGATHFFGNGIDDVLWTSTNSNGAVATDIWELGSNGKWAASVSPGNHAAGYSVAGTGDWTGDGTDGILWYNASTGDTDEWQLAGGQWSASVDLGGHPGAGWTIAGVGDFFDNGRDDVLWTNSSGGSVQTDIWELGSNGQWINSVSPGSHPAGYSVVGVGDFTGTGTSDILWYNASTGDTDEWLIKNGQWAGSVDLGSHPGNFQIAGVGDFNGNGTKDILWHNN